MRTCLVMLMTLSITFLVCAKKEEESVGEQGGTLFIGTTDLPSTLSPLAPSIFSSNEFLDLLFVHLHRIDPETGKMRPELASSWEFSEDLTEITYYLRNDIMWWDSTSVTAEDVYYTYQKMKDPNTHYPNRTRLRFIKDVEVLDTYVIKFAFDRVYADLLTDSDIMAVPKHIHEQSGDTFGQHPIGNGSFKIKEWIPGKKLVLIANDAYHRGRPLLDEIHILYYRSPRVMIEDYTNGYLDVILNITPSLANDLAQEEQVVIDSRPGNTYTYIGWNLNNPYLKEKDIRKALSLAIDKNRILEEVFEGSGSISLGPLPQSSWGYNEMITPIGYDASEAQRILLSKGFEDRNYNGVLDRGGRDFTIDIITNSENPERVAMLDLIAGDLRSLGIKVRTKTLGIEPFIEAIIRKNFDGFIMGWSVDDKIDPTAYWHSDPSKGIFNFVSYQNKMIDSLMEEGVAMLNRKKARKIWNEFQRIIYEDIPYTFLIVANRISSFRKRIKGIDQGIVLAYAHNYWIPEDERRISVASLAQPARKETLVSTPEPAQELEDSLTVRPEELLEATVRQDTAAIAALSDTTEKESLVGAPAPPKPSIITRAVPIKKVTPKYPESARTIGATGRVVIRVLISTEGEVKEAHIISSFGNPACEVAALDAAEQWEFKPATNDGVPFEQRVSIPFDFGPPE